MSLLAPYTWTIFWPEIVVLIKNPFLSKFWVHRRIVSLLPLSLNVLFILPGMHFLPLLFLISTHPLDPMIDISRIDRYPLNEKLHWIKWLPWLIPATEMWVEVIYITSVCHSLLSKKHQKAHTHFSCLPLVPLRWWVPDGTAATRWRVGTSSVQTPAQLCGAGSLSAHVG